MSPLTPDNELKYRQKGWNNLTVNAFVIAAICYGIGATLLPSDVMGAIIAFLMGGLSNCIGLLWTYEVYGGCDE